MDFIRKADEFHCKNGGFMLKMMGFAGEIRGAHFEAAAIVRSLPLPDEGPAARRDCESVRFPSIYPPFSLRFPRNRPILKQVLLHFVLMLGGDDRSPIIAHLEVGDMLLWDSRTIHCSAASGKPDGLSIMSTKAINCVLTTLLCCVRRPPDDGDAAALREPGVHAAEGELPG